MTGSVAGQSSQARVTKTFAATVTRDFADRSERAAVAICHAVDSDSEIFASV